MARNGLSIRAPDGIEIISETDRVARVVGSHTLPPIERNGYYRKEYHHPELKGQGELFAWFDAAGFWNISAEGRVVVSGYTIIVELKTSSGGSAEPVTPQTKVHYGVR